MYEDKYDFLNDEVEEKDICFWIDPLDGTGGFVNGHTEHVTCNMGISIKGKPLFGVIGKPFVQNYENISETYVGGVNVGLHKISSLHINFPQTARRQKSVALNLPMRYSAPFSDSTRSRPIVCASMNKNQDSMDKVY